MDRMLKVGIAALLLATGTAGAQEAAKQTPANAAQGAVVRNPDAQPVNTPFGVWSDFLTGLKAIRGDNAPEAIRATPEQEKTIVEANREFRQQYGDFLRTNRPELSKLRAQLGDHNTNGVQAERELVAAGEQGGVSSKDMEASIQKTNASVEPLKQGTPEWNAALKQFRTIMGQCPDAATFKARVEATLSPEQRAAVTKRTETAVANRAQRVKDAAGAERTMASLVNEYNINNPAIPEHVRERWARMTVSQKFKTMQGIERRLKVNGGTWNRTTPANPQSQANVPSQQQSPEQR